MLYRLQKVVRHIAQTEVMPRFLNTPSRRKEDGSVLSEADLAAQTAFAAALPLLEDCPMLGEEMSVQEQTRLWNEHFRRPVDCRPHRRHKQLRQRFAAFCRIRRTG